MSIFNVLRIFGGLALFLYGMSLMGSSLEKLGGGKFEKTLARLTSNPLKGVVLGAAVTAVIQSSSATTVMVVGFVNSGIMQLHQAVGIIMGANIGTTITSWILSLSGIEGSSFLINIVKPANFTPVLAFIGIVLIMACKSDRRHNIGYILIGFAVLMFGMEMMSDSVSPLKDVPQFTSLLTKFSNPILGIIVGALLTAVIQSSSASVGILQALSSTGAITFGAAVPIIMGQNIGTCVTALVSCIGASKNAKRAAMVHLYFNIIGTAIFLILFYTLNAVIGFSFINDSVAQADIAIIHSIFNIFSAVVLLPFNRVLEKLAKITIRDGVSVDTFAKLDDRFLQTPSFAIDQCATLTVNMAYIAKEAYTSAVECMTEYSEEGDKRVMENEDEADKYEDALGSYLVKISSKNLSNHDSMRVSLLLHTIEDVEKITDYSADILYRAREKKEKQIEFSEKALKEAELMAAAVNEAMDLTIQAFENNDFKCAYEVEPLEEVIDMMKSELKDRHIRRMRDGKCSVDKGFLFTDYINTLEKISDHCANIAVTLIELDDNSFNVHSYAIERKAEPSFKAQCAEYAKKYALPFSLSSSGSKK